ncbi:hypothetical protein [Rhodobacteraceae bacterium DSL-40]|uniref:hypothetical protein n=1 Tax=Amaricoccus sp. B4 TaxID=3368557 RepID=UPI000DAD5577
MAKHFCTHVERDFAFDFVPVFPEDLFEDPEICVVLAEAGITPDARGNRLAVLRTPQARIAFLEAEDRVKEAMWNAGWAVSAGAGEAAESEAARSSRLRDRIVEKAASMREGRISPQVMRLCVLQLHRFEAERLQGRRLDPGALREALPGGGDEVHLPEFGMWEAQALIQAADRLRANGATTRGV